MASSFLLSKHVHFSNFIFKRYILPRVLISSRSFCSKDNDSSNQQQKTDKSTSETPEKQPKEASEKTVKISEPNAKAADHLKQAAEIKIANLLADVQVAPDAPVKTPSKLELAKPLKRISKKERYETLKANEITPEKELDMAVKNVARSFENPEEIETQLSEKLDSLKPCKEDAVIDESQVDNDVSERLMSSVADVAETISDTPIPPREELTQKLVKMSAEKKSLPEQIRPVYYNDRFGPRHQRRRGPMSVMAQVRLEAERAASVKQRSPFVEQKKLGPKYYNDDPAPRYYPRKSLEMSVIERMRQEAKYAASAKKESYAEQEKPILRQTKDEFKQRQWEREHQGGEMSVIEQMRLEAQSAAFNKRNSVMENKPMSRQSNDEFKQRHWEHESDDMQPRDEFKHRQWKREHQGGEISVMDQVRLEAQSAAFNKMNSVMENKSTSRSANSQARLEALSAIYKRKNSDMEERHTSGQSNDEFKQRHWEREHESGEMSVIAKMRLEALSDVYKRKNSDMEKTPTSKPQLRKIDLFGSTPLNIFQVDSETKPEPGNVFWQKLQAKQLRLLFQFAPANGFEEMIMWTEQGKHWKFPIDNETEMGAEEKIGFNEHVFLEQHLKGFPTRGPIRHFMELVCVALSKNPYITVERKIENIDWFRNYFKEKEDILKEAGALV